MVSKRHPTAYDEHEGSRKCHTKLLLRENTLDHTQTKTWNSRISAIITCFFSEHNSIIYESACLPRTAEARDGILLFGDRFVVNLEYCGDVVKSAVEWTSFPTPISIHWDLRRNHISLRASRQWFVILVGRLSESSSIFRLSLWIMWEYASGMGVLRWRGVHFLDFQANFLYSQRTPVLYMRISNFKLICTLIRIDSRLIYRDVYTIQ